MQFFHYYAVLRIFPSLILLETMLNSAYILHII